VVEGLAQGIVHPGIPRAIEPLIGSNVFRNIDTLFYQQRDQYQADDR
jgi:hypothetical protein